MSNSIGKRARPFDQPLVSICVPTYNAERTAVQTLESILNQTYRNIEVIVVDNASTDNTVSLLREIDDPRIRIYCNDTNIGAEKNFSRCIQLANGEYTAIFHADDLYMPDMIQKQVQAFRDNPTVGAVFTMAKRINSRNEVIGEINLPSELKGKRIYYFTEAFLSLLENLNFFVCPSCMVRSKLYKELGPFNGERFGSSLDLDMWLRILEKQPVAILEDKLMHYRVSSVHWSFEYNYLRTDEADFFKVMDYYLSAKSSVLDIPLSTLNKYEFLKSIDNIRGAVNHLIKSQSQDAKKLLRRSFSANIFRGAIGYIRRPKLLGYWILGAMLLVLTCLGLGQYLGKSLHWLLYRWKRRFV